jgi:hypothetical protein
VHGARTSAVIVKASSGPRYVVACRNKVDKSKLTPTTRVTLDMTTLTIMRILPREVGAAPGACLACLAQGPLAPMPAEVALQGPNALDAVRSAMRSAWPPAAAPPSWARP